MDDMTLLRMAHDAMKNAYVPYSNFPVGAALLGHSAGDKVEITLPTGAVVLYEVLEVGRADI